MESELLSYRELVDILDYVSATTNNLLPSPCDTSDARRRAELIHQARTLGDRILRPEAA